MKQEHVDHSYTKTYPQNPQTRAYLGYGGARNEPEAAHSHPVGEKTRDWQNPSRFAHRSLW